VVDHFLVFGTLQHGREGGEESLSLPATGLFQHDCIGIVVQRRQLLDQGSVVGSIRFGIGKIVRLQFEEGDVVGVAGGAALPHRQALGLGQHAGMQHHRNGVEDGDIVLVQEGQMLDQEFRQGAPHAALAHHIAHQHQPGVLQRRHAPPGIARQLVGQRRRMHHRDHCLLLGDQQQLGQMLLRQPGLALPRPAGEVHRITAG